MGNLANLTHTELNSIRELVISHQGMSTKLATYAQQCQDAQLKQMFGTASQQAKQAAQNLIQML